MAAEVPTAFVLTEFNSSIQLSEAGTFGSTPIPSLTYDCNAIFEVPLSTMRSIFSFHTDSVDMTNTTDINDVTYWVDASAWANLVATGVNPANADTAHADCFLSEDPVVKPIAAGQTKSAVCHDYVRYLAYRLFNTYHGVDLFDNEIELLADIRDKCSADTSVTEVPNVMEKIQGVMDAAGSVGSKLTNATVTSDNIVRTLLEQLKNAHPARLSNLQAGEDQDFPFVDGDSISFNLTIDAATNQNSLTGVDAIPARVYGITLKMVSGEPSNLEVDPAEIPVPV